MIYRAVSTGFRDHPLVHEFVSIHQSVGWKLTARENKGKSQRRLKRDAKRLPKGDEVKLYEEILRRCAIRPYKSWRSVFEDLSERKEAHPGGALLTTLKSFHKLRKRLGLIESKPSRYRIPQSQL